MLGKINGKLKFLYRKQSCLDNSLHRLLLNALIQPHFDYAYASLFPMLNKMLSKNIHAISAKQMHSLLFLNLKNTAHVGATEFKAINWLPTKNRVDQHTCVNIMKFFKGMAPAYADEIFQPVDESRVTRRSKFELNLPLRKSSAGQKCLYYIGPKFWNSLSSDLKSKNSISIRLSTGSRTIFSKICRERKKQSVRKFFISCGRKLFAMKFPVSSPSQQLNRSK